MEIDQTTFLFLHKKWQSLEIESHLVVAVNPGLDLAVQDELHELLLQGREGRVEALGHHAEVGREVRADKKERI